MTIQLVTRSIWANPGNGGKRLKKTLDALIWQIQKRTLRTPRLLRLSNGLLFKAYPDCVVSSGLIYADWPEFNELMFVRKSLQPSDVVIDVGAYVGHISLLLADIVGAGKLFAFEPTPSSFQRLKENWQINGWPATNLFQSAVGAEQGTVFVRNDKQPCTMNNVTATPGDNQSVAVALVRLDDYLGHWRGSQLGFIKIDVEGYEIEVFKGSQQLLQEARPRLIMFESLGGRLEPAISELLSAQKYVVFQLGADGRPDFTCHHAQNLFAVPEENRGAFS